MFSQGNSENKVGVIKMGNKGLSKHFNCRVRKKIGSLRDVVEEELERFGHCLNVSGKGEAEVKVNS